MRRGSKQYELLAVEATKEALAMKAEIARLKALTAEMNKTINASQSECRRLKAEVERLTKKKQS